MDTKQHNDLIASILATTVEQAARKLAEEACKRGGMTDAALDIHGNVWDYITDSVRLAYEAAEDRNLLHREIERLRADLDAERAATVKRLASLADKVSELDSELDDLLGALESEPFELVNFEDMPSEDSSVRDVMEWLQNGSGSGELTKSGEKVVERVRERLLAVSEELTTLNIEASTAKSNEASTVKSIASTAA